MLFFLALSISCTFLCIDAVAGDGICSTGASATTGGCVAYEHADFDGRHQDLRPNHIKTYVGDRMNDKISSFRVSPGCRVVVWEDRDKGGASQAFGECQYIGDDWNDDISSWQCECR
ncbi:peptidase inhibitor family I36 protein [Pseudomonas sp. WJP1]|uniref:peptidase inhibitor family I36 protein n=1 Tax=Pseudomonas sp. WJP1 TaxID=2986947 RepID=UPI003FA72154